MSESIRAVYACPPTKVGGLSEFGVEIVIPAEGSITGTCIVCTQPIWIGPKQQEKMKTLPGETQCFHCARTLQPGMIASLAKKGATYIKKGGEK